MRTTTFIAVLLLAGLATAQTMVPLPAFGSTFSGSAMTRGFFFQAPVDFTVVGLRVPDEFKDGKQNVVLFNHTAAPPAFSSVANLTPAFLKFGEPSANQIPCAVNYKKGDWLIVIGACGTATMRNSYAAVRGCVMSTIFGQPISLCRCGTQFNIVSKVPPYPVWSEVAGNISRVEVYVASASLVGSGTGGIGTTLSFMLTAAADAGLPYQMGSSFGNGPIPIDTRSLGLSGDSLLFLSVGGLLPAVFKNYSGKLDTTGAAKASLDIPNLTILKGIRIYTAFVTLLGTAPSGVASISNSFLVTIT